MTSVMYIHQLITVRLHVDLLESCCLFVHLVRDFS